MSRQRLIEMTVKNLADAAADRVDLAPDVYRVPAANYFDPDRFEAEKRGVFRRMPLILAPTAELPEPGDYKAMDAAGVPVLLARGQDGEVRAFINSCSHRGTAVALDGTGNRRRFTCPYHGWTFDGEGALVAIADASNFGDIDRSCYGLTRLPVAERVGLIWCVLDPESTLDIDAFLSGYDSMLANFGLETWHLFDKRTIRGPNWKIAYDGYMDLYHLPVLHKDTIGGGSSNRATYTAWGPHQRVVQPSRHSDLADQPQDEWPTATLMNGVWTVFPHVSIASFYGGGHSIMLSQLFPGASPGESFTTQYYLMENVPDDAQTAEANEQFKLLKYVVETEDYGTGLRQQKALEAGGRDHVLFGRNEGGGQRFHGWVDRLLETPDDDLNALFRPEEASAG